MTIQEFISKAIDGGWSLWPDSSVDYDDVKCFVTSENYRDTYLWEYVLLDPKAWQAVGKVKGWGQELEEKGKCLHCGIDTRYQPPKETGCNHVHFPEGCFVCGNKSEDYEDKMHRMIDALCEGKTIEQFISTI